MGIGFRLTKIADIGYTAILHATFALVLAKVFDTVSEKVDTEENTHKTSLRLFLEVTLYVWAAGVTIYLVRNIMGMIPSPLEGLYGFRHFRLKELNSANIFIFVFFYFGESLKKKITVLYDRILI